jgi:hypothetical protein
MISLRAVLVLAALAIAGALPAAAQAAPAHHLCVPVRATGVGQDLGGGRTQATISVHHVVVGTTNASFTITGQEGAVANFNGPIVFSSRLGTLTAHVTGQFDLGAGAFKATSTSITGSGLLAAVTGRVTVAGTEDFATGSFTETITGRLCVT